jgi:hypothetical protein
LFSRAAKFFGITNKYCILFGRAAKNFGIDQQKLRLSVFCSAAQHKVLELPTKETQMNCLQNCTGGNNEREDNRIRHSRTQKDEEKKKWDSRRKREENLSSGYNEIEENSALTSA